MPGYDNEQDSSGSLTPPGGTLNGVYYKGVGGLTNDASLQYNDTIQQLNGGFSVVTPFVQANNSAPNTLSFKDDAGTVRMSINTNALGGGVSIGSTVAPSGVRLYVEDTQAVQLIKSTSAGAGNLTCFNLQNAQGNSTQGCLADNTTVGGGYYTLCNDNTSHPFYWNFGVNTAGGRALKFDNSRILTFMGANSTITTDTAKNLTISTDTTGVLSIDSGTTGAVNIATGANAKTVSIGNTTSTTSVSVSSGTGGTSAQTTGTGTISIGSNASTGSVSIATGSQASLSLGTGTTARAITVGNTTGTSSLSMSVGTGNFTLDGVASSTYTIGASTTTGTITVGGTAQTGTMTLGSSSGTNTQIIAGGSGDTTLQIANVQTAGSVSIGAGMTTGTISIGGTGLQTGQIDIAPGTGAQTTAIANGTGIKTINIGNGISGNTLNVLNGANTTAQTVNIASGANGANSTINIGIGTPTAGQKTITIGSADTFSKTKILGGVEYSVATLNATSTIASSANYVLASGTITLTLPTAVIGKTIVVKNVGTGTVTVQQSSGNLDSTTSSSLASIALSSASSQFFISDGTGWYLI